MQSPKVTESLGLLVDGEFPAGPAKPCVLLVDDEPSNVQLCRLVLSQEGFHCEEANNGVAALEVLSKVHCDLILLDIDMPKMLGTEVLRRVRQNPPSPYLKIIMVSGRATGDEMAEMLAAGADDYLTKPFSIVQLAFRVKAALNLKAAQDRTDLLNRHLRTVNQSLEQSLTARNSDLVHARNALVLALAELVAYRDTESGAHLLRLQHYSRRLGDAAASGAAFAGQIDDNFLHMLECCAPLHDIGKAGVPDRILLKPGKLDPEEWVIMQTHTTMGAAVLSKVAQHHGFAIAFLQMAIDICRHHHERYDGTGYPDRLAGNAIPLAARIVAIADVYDALRSRRCYKPALSHVEAVEIMGQSKGHFDPVLFQVFLKCADQFDRLYAELDEKD